MHVRIRTTPAGRHAAFTLLEVLIAMGIFAVGFVAVAAIFPTAVLLQKKTVDDVVAQQVARNAQALLKARGFELGDGSSDGHLWRQLIENSSVTTFDTDQRVHPVPLSMLSVLTPAPSPAPEQQWLLSDRSYPSSTNPVEARKVFWVPLVRDPNKDAGVIAGDVLVYVFILQRAVDGSYPRPGLTPEDWVNFYDGFEEERHAAPPYNPIAPGPDANDTFSVPAVTRQSVSVDKNNLQRFDFGANNNVFTSGGQTYLRVNIGDKILDCYGGIYTVSSADNNGVNVSGFINPNLDTSEYPDEIWFAHPDAQGRLRPAVRILTLSQAVK